MTASKSFGWSNTRRKSLYFLAFRNLWAAASTAFWLTSQRTVMFSAGIPVGGPEGASLSRRRRPPSPFMFARPRPPQAIIAMFSLLWRFRARRKVGAPVITPAAARALPTIWRRLIRRSCVFLVICFFIVCLFWEREVLRQRWRSEQAVGPEIGYCRRRRPGPRSAVGRARGRGGRRGSVVGSPCRSAGRCGLCGCRARRRAWVPPRPQGFRARTAKLHAT